MRLLDSYAVVCGAKIDKPYLLEVYFPLPFTKFITFQAQSRFDSKDYEYWQDVINMLSPVLQKAGIYIIQLGQQNEVGYQRVIDLRGQTSLQQMAYLIKRAQLHMGPDSIGVHIASSFDVPLVGLYSATYKQIGGPHFGTTDKQILFEGYARLGTGKPSFGAQESPKSINTIKPEEVAHAVLKLLNIDFKIPFETVHLGPRYGYKMVRELVPDAPMMLPNPEQPIEIRYDIEPNEKLLPHLLSIYKRALVITEKDIDVNLLANFKPHIAAVVYRVTKDSTADFVSKAMGKGLSVILVSELPPEEIEKKKIEFYEYGRINPANAADPKIVEKLKPDLDKLYYRSSKMLASQGKMFPSQAALAAGLPMQNDFEYFKVIDSPTFWKDLDFFTIVRKNV